jgi:hypothetical protein
MAAWSVGAGRASSRALLVCAGRAMSLAPACRAVDRVGRDDTRGDDDRSDAIALQLHEQADKPLVRFTDLASRGTSRSPQGQVTEP